MYPYLQFSEIQRCSQIRKAYRNWPNQNWNPHLQNSSPIYSPLVWSQGFGCLLSESYSIAFLISYWQICCRYQNYYLNALLCLLFPDSPILYISNLLQKSLFGFLMMKDLVEAVPKLPLALTLVSWILGRHSIAVTTLASAGNIGEDGILSCTWTWHQTCWCRDTVAEGRCHGLGPCSKERAKMSCQTRIKCSEAGQQCFQSSYIGNASLRLKNVQLHGCWHL